MEQFKKYVDKAKSAALTTTNAAAALTGNPILTIASATVNSSSSSSGISSMSELQKQGQDFNMEFLKLQNEMQIENRKFTTLSNISKAKHDTAKSAINNIRA